MHLITTITHYLLTHLGNFQASASIFCDQEIIIGQRGSLPVMPLGYLYFKTVLFRNFADHAETVSAKVRRSPQMKKMAALAEAFLDVT